MGAESASPNLLKTEDFVSSVELLEAGGPNLEDNLTTGSDLMVVVVSLLSSFVAIFRLRACWACGEGEREFSVDFGDSK